MLITQENQKNAIYVTTNDSIIIKIFVEMCQDLGLDLVFLLIYLAKTLMSCIC